MADEIQNNASNEQGTAVPGEQLSPVQQEALSQGWVPKEEYDGDPERWVDAGEFVRRGELFRKIESQSKELKDVKKALAELGRHNSKIREVEYQRALEALKTQKKEALAEGDTDRVVEIDDRIDLVKDQQRLLQNEVVQQNVPQEVHPELRNWINKNSWYESSVSMRAWADARGVELAQEGKSPNEVLNTLEKEVKSRFSEKFRNPNRDRASAVETAPGRGSSKSEPDYELTDVEKRVMKTLIDQKVLTKEEYVAQLKAIKERS